MKVTIADSLFLSHSKSAFLGGSNHASPSYFSWEPADPGTARFVTDSDIKYARGKGQIAWLLEPYELHPENYSEAEKKGFTAVLTHNRALALKKGWLFYPHGGSWIDFDFWGMKEKTKLCSILISDKNTLPGHKLRHRIAGKYRSKIDVLGYPDRISAYDAYAPYRYSIVVENHRGTCFTERLMDCMSVGTVPIYWGCTDLRRYFDMRGIIPFDNMHDLERIIDKLIGVDDYNYSVSSIALNGGMARKYAVVEDWLFQNYFWMFTRGKNDHQ